MRNIGFLDTALLREEKKSTYTYIGLVYSVGLIYCLFYYYFFPYFVWDLFKLEIFLTLLSPFILLLLVVPFIVLFLRANHLHLQKFVFAGTLVFLLMATELISYYMTDLYDGGNITELFMVIFAAIFVNQSFFWFVTGALLTKYLFTCLIFPELFFQITLPIGLSAIVCLLGYVILRRFMAYVNSLNIVYNDHFSNMVKGIIAMLELKDPHTRGHSERVAKYSVALARRVGGFSEQELNIFYYSCLLHDIGKMQISDDILTKPDKLTDHEYEVVKMHTVFGVNAIKDIPSLQPSIDIVRHHHERWDGKGYPDNLKGEEIPLLTRIASIADAFDAMTSHRAYRAALTPDEAYARIVKGGGTQFDPGLIPHFKNVFPTWLSILHDYHDTHEEEYNRLYGAEIYA